MQRTLRSNRFSRSVGLTGLTILSVSLLTAAGELQWKSQPRPTASAPPPIALLSANANTNTTTKEASASTRTNDPIFKPFVLVSIPLPTGFSYGEVMDVNNAGQAVGWMYDDTAQHERAFFFDPEQGSFSQQLTILDTPEQDMDASWAYSISDEATPTIAGAVMYKANPDYLRVALWDGPTDEAYTPLGSGIVSAAFDVKVVTTTTTVIGTYKNGNGDDRSFVYNGSLSYPAATSDSQALGSSSTGEVVGWHLVSGDSHAYSWVSGTTSDIHDSTYDYSGALAVNTSGDIAGWVADDLNEKVPALWTSIVPGVYSVEPFVTGANSIVTDLNEHGEMAISRLDESGVAIWSKRSGVDQADLLDDLTLMPNATDLLNTANAINDKGWVGGSFLETGTGNPLPCLVIPYDVDNNGTPDFREILSGKATGQTDLDTNDNWLLDWAEHLGGTSGEGMRVGLHAPDGSTHARAIENTQIIRQSVHFRHLNFDSGNPGTFPIDEILEDSQVCDDFTEYLNNWTNEDEQREAIIWLRSTLVEGDEQYDYLPQSQTERDALKADLQEFAYRYARCIDYIQTGNEVFGGSGGYKFYETDLPNCPHSWSGAKLFKDIHPDCQAEAVDEILDWLDDQMWTALQGSALAGRPLRMIGPGIPSSTVNAGFDAAGPSRALMQELVPWLNDRQMYFDLHNHYKEVDEGLSRIEKLMDESSTAAPWDDVHRAVCLELAPKVSAGDWATNNFSTFGDFVDPACPDPGTNWWDFVLTWRFDDFSDDFEIDSFLAAFAAPGSNASKAFSAVCYTTGQLDPPNIVYDMAALRATQVCVTYIGNGQGSTLYTPITYEYQTAAAAYNIEEFTPHPTGCTGCPN